MHSLFHGSPTGFCFLFPLGFFLIFAVTAACTTSCWLCLLLLDLFSYSKALKCAEYRFSCCCCRRCSFTRLLTETSCRRQQCWRVWWKSQQRGPPLLELSVTGRVATIRKESSTVRAAIWRQQLRELYYQSSRRPQFEYRTRDKPRGRHFSTLWSSRRHHVQLCHKTFCSCQIYCKTTYLNTQRR